MTKFTKFTKLTKLHGFEAWWVEGNIDYPLAVLDLTLTYVILT
jgi:hypothetical protein